MNELVIPEDTMMSKLDDADLKGLVGSDFLPRLQVNSSNTEACKAGLCDMNVWGLLVSKNRCDNLGKEIEAILCAWRPQAIKINKATGQNLYFYDRTSAEFRGVITDANTDNRNNLFGIGFLVWLPVADTFATYFACSKSARVEAANFIDLMKKPEGGYKTAKVTLKMRGASNSLGSWMIGYAEPLTGDLPIPEAESFQTEMDRFLNPKASAAKKAETDERVR